eukprot:366140-Chlamydomonas_euryale.AAC.2
MRRVGAWGYDWARKGRSAARRRRPTRCPGVAHHRQPGGLLPPSGITVVTRSLGARANRQVTA